MPPSKLATRAQQPTTQGLGNHFSSPRKRRNKKKTTTLVQPLARETDIQRLRAKVEELKRQALRKKSPLPTITSTNEECQLSFNTDDSETLSIDESNPFPQEPSAIFASTKLEDRPLRRTLPNDSAKNLYSSWADALTRLITPLLEYISKSMGKVPERVVKLESTCKGVNGCIMKMSEPRMAISVHLLDFYRALFERSCDAVNAMASALNTFYSRRGFVVLDKKGAPVKDAFRRGLGYAAQWYDNLQLHLERYVDAAVLHSDTRIQKNMSQRMDNAAKDLQAPLIPSEIPSSTDETSSQSECARLLQQRCPACFGGELFGRSLKHEGGDIQVCVDGNFNHRHLRAAGDSPHFYDPEYIIPKDFVDSVGARIQNLRKTRKPKPRTAVVPDEAVNECESSHVAGTGSNIKTNMEKFDDGGLMALVCRHDIPIFLANIDTPGEQQKYAVSMIEHLFSLIPAHATVFLLYDVACVLDRSLNTRSRRRYIIDRHVASIGLEIRDDLGSWMRRRLTKGIEAQGQKAQQILVSCGVEQAVLRHEWELQQASELSVRAHAPNRLRKELDTVLALQGDLDTCEKTLRATRQTLAKTAPSPHSLRILATLQTHHEQLKDSIEELYTSLSLQDSYPELCGVDLEFIRTLFIARDLKQTIRKHAIGSFFEWDRLDQASGGRNQTLGTKLHQATCAAIKKRAPALMAGLHKYNALCVTLASLHKPEWSIPLPEPLPTELKPLRDAPNLMQDVWISRPMEEAPRWLVDKEVREGIRALLKVDRCTEEQQRLTLEAGNLCRWFSREFAAVELALNNPANASIQIPLQQRRTRLLNLRTQWTSPITPQQTFNDLVQKATDFVQSFATSHISDPIAHCWTTVEEHVEESLEGEDASDLQDDATLRISEDLLFTDYLTCEDIEVLDSTADSNTVPLIPGVDLAIVWSLPPDMLYHKGLVTELQFQTFQEFAPLSSPRLAQKNPWVSEVKEIMSFAARLILLANLNGNPLPVIASRWIARPTILQARQTNGFDCGVWVIANIAAILSGFQVTDIQEPDIIVV
ncbi:hypothetical protein C0992_011981 [Termitomyces sp. T32_za158]|nr:hypothetical protein C0992_011981 [Termitomyces sp. T32_za158]